MTAENSPRPAPLLSRRRGVCALALGLIGFASAVAAIYATPIAGVTDLGCGPRVLDCGKVLGSRWGKIAGVPLGVWGGFYFVWWMLLLVADRRSTNRSAFRWCLTWTLTAGATISLLLLGLLAFVIKGACLFCLITHASNLGAAALLWPDRRWRLAAGELLRARRSLVILSVLTLLTGLGLFQLYQLRAARAEVISREKTIW